MTDELIQAQVSATRVTCRRMSGVHLKALRDSVDMVAAGRAVDGMIRLEASWQTRNSPRQW